MFNSSGLFLFSLFIYFFKFFSFFVCVCVDPSSYTNYKYGEGDEPIDVFKCAHLIFMFFFFYGCCGLTMLTEDEFNKVYTRILGGISKMHY